MAVGASQPTVVASKDGRIGMKSQMQVTTEIHICRYKCWNVCKFLCWHHANIQVNVTADHRVIYGADLASFLQTLAKIFEGPKDLTF